MAKEYINYINKYINISYIKDEKTTVKNNLSSSFSKLFYRSLLVTQEREL